MERVRLLATWLLIDSALIATAELPRWKTVRMSVWAAADGFCPAKRTFFLGFRLHLLVDSRGGLCDVVISPADIGERARDRNRGTGDTLNALGLPEFYAAKAFVTTYEMP
jgi:hypothetical protein